MSETYNQVSMDTFDVTKMSMHPNEDDNKFVVVYDRDTHPLGIVVRMHARFSDKGPFMKLIFATSPDLQMVSIGESCDANAKSSHSADKWCSLVKFRIFFVTY